MAALGRDGPALVLFAVMWLTTAAVGDDPREDVVVRAVLAACVGVGTLAGARRGYRRRRELQEDVDGEFEEMVAAERVVRRGQAPVSEWQRRLAVRIAELRWREAGGRWGPGLLGAVVVLGWSSRRGGCRWGSRLASSLSWRTSRAPASPDGTPI